MFGYLGDKCIPWSDPKVSWFADLVYFFSSGKIWNKVSHLLSVDAVFCFGDKIHLSKQCVLVTHGQYTA